VLGAVKPSVASLAGKEILMAHLIEQMAYVGATPWHGLGNRLTRKQRLETWQREAGMD